MTLEERINEDIKAAMLAREKEKLNALRAIKSAILLAKTSKGAADTMSEEAEIKLLKQLVKQRQDSAAIYKEQNRDDLYQEEKAQLDVIAAYLPQMMSEEEIEATQEAYENLVVVSEYPVNPVPTPVLKLKEGVTAIEVSQNDQINILDYIETNYPEKIFCISQSTGAMNYVGEIS